MANRQLVAERLTDVELDIVVRELALGMARGDVEHDEFRVRAIRAEGDHRLESQRRIAGDDLLIFRRQLIEGRVFHDLLLLRVGTPLRECIERCAALGERIVHGVGETMRDADLGGGDLRDDQDMTPEHLGRLRPLDVDDVEAERRLDGLRDLARPHMERPVLELLHHHTTAEPPQLSALRSRCTVAREALGGRREIPAVTQLHDQ